MEKDQLDKILDYWYGLSPWNLEHNREFTRKEIIKAVQDELKQSLE